MPVGQNLQDHILTPLMPFVIEKPLSIVAERDFTIEYFMEYFLKGEGTINILHNIMSFTTENVKQTVKMKLVFMRKFYQDRGLVH